MNGCGAVSARVGSGLLGAMPALAERPLVPPIVSWLAEEEAISFLGEPRFLRHSRCTIELAEPLYTPKWRALATGSPEIAHHSPRTFELSEAEREGLSSWRVRPSVVAVEGRSVEILRFPAQ